MKKLIVIIGLLGMIALTGCKEEKISKPNNIGIERTITENILTENIITEETIVEERVTTWENVSIDEW